MLSVSKHSELLISLGFIEDVEPSEMRDALLALRRLPEKPIYILVVDEDDGQEMTLVVDDTGALWVTNRAVRLSAYGFGDYAEFRKTIGRKIDG